VLRDQTMGSLSGGEKVKLQILKLMKESMELLLLDEPTRNLSLLSNPKIINLLNQFADCMICVTYDRLLSEHWKDRLIKLQKYTTVSHLFLHKGYEAIFLYQNAEL